MSEQTLGDKPELPQRAPTLSRPFDRADELRNAYVGDHKEDLPAVAVSLKVDPTEPSAAADAEEDLEKTAAGLTEEDLEKGDGSASNGNGSAEEKKDPNMVDWDGPDDSANPMNWPPRKKWSLVAVLSAITFTTWVHLQSVLAQSKD